MMSDSRLSPSGSHPAEAENVAARRASAEAIAAEFRARLIASLEMLCGESVEVIAEPANADTEIEWRRHPLNTDPPTALVTGAPGLIGRAIGARVLSAAGLDDFTEEDVAGSFAEVLQSALSAVAHWLGKEMGKDLSLAESTAFSPEAPPPFEYRYRIQFGDQSLAPLAFGIPSSLVDLLHPQNSASAVSGGAPSPTPGFSASASAASPKEDLRRVLELELPIRVSFGKAHVPLRDVLKLSTGSIVELDRTIHDPVDIIVNDRVVGRGEVVVIDGNYGVRIQEIVSLGSA